MTAKDGREWKIELCSVFGWIRLSPQDEPMPWRLDYAPGVCTANWDEESWAKHDQYVKKQNDLANDWHEKYPWFDRFTPEGQERLRVFQEQTGLSIP